MGTMDYVNIKEGLAQSYRAMLNHPGRFPLRKPSAMEKRTEIFETSPNLSGAIQFVMQEQNDIQSSLPQQWVNHFKPFPFPINHQWIGVNNDPCGMFRPQSVKGMVQINKHIGSKAAYFDFLRTSCTFDQPGLTLYVETECGSCRDVQIIMNDNRIDVLALREEMHDRNVTDVNGAYSCFVLRRYSRTIHLPHPIEHKEACLKQDSNVVCAFIPWKCEV